MNTLPPVTDIHLLQEELLALGTVVSHTGNKHFCDPDDSRIHDAPRISEIIAMAWCDKTSFDSIELITGLQEKEVIALMRANLKRSSFKMWRKRVTGRKAKHTRKQRPT